MNKMIRSVNLKENKQMKKVYRSLREKTHKYLKAVNSQEGNCCQRSFV